MMIGICPTPKTRWQSIRHHILHGLLMNYPLWAILFFAFLIDSDLLIEGEFASKCEVRFYCEICEDYRVMTTERLQADDLNGDSIWGDIVCNECGLVICTIEADEEGDYEMVKA